jgi:hypothetical protein
MVTTAVREDKGLILEKVQAIKHRRLSNITIYVDLLEAWTPRKGLIKNMKYIEINKEFYDQIVKNKVTILGGLDGETIIVTVVKKDQEGITKILIPKQQDHAKSN